MSKAKDYESTLKRLNIIISRLYLGEALSVTELAKEFNVSTRTVQRYFNDYLLPSGFALKKSGKRWILENPVDLSLDQRSEVAFDAIENLAKSAGILDKVKPYLNRLKLSSINNPFYAKLDMEKISEKLDEIAVIESGIKNKNVLKIEYKIENKRYEFSVQPLKIANFEGYWYLLGIDCKDDYFKKFHLNSVTKVELTEKIFEISKDFQNRIENAINVWFDPYSEPFEVTLFADSIAAKYLRRIPISKTQVIEGVDSDGSVQISIKVTDKMEIKNIIKYWIPHIRVLEPKWLDDEIKVEVREFLESS